MTELPTDPIRAEHRELAPHLGHVESAAAKVTGWDRDAASRRLGGILSFLRDDLLPHARVEEEVLYPAVDRLVGQGATATMSVDHVVIGERVDALTEAVDDALDHWDDVDRVADISRRLAALAAIVELHFRKEEEVLLPVLDSGLSLAEGHELFGTISHAGHGSHHG